MNHHKPLGWRPGPHDARDFRLLPHIKAEKEQGRIFYVNPLRLDQGREGSCVGHGWTQSINSAPKRHNYSHEFAVKIYQRAQLLDEFDDTPPEEGTSVRAGAKACQEASLVSAYAFCYSVEEMALYILNHGSLVIGVNWHTGMDDPSKANGYYITPDGDIRGGHCVCVDGIRYEGQATDWVRILNSWGPGWGYDGRCKMLLADFRTLMAEADATACAAVEA